MSITRDTVWCPWSEQAISSTSSPLSRSRSTAWITRPALASAWRSTARCSGEPSGRACCVTSGSPIHMIASGGERSTSTSSMKRVVMALSPAASWAMLKACAPSSRLRPGPNDPAR